MHRYLYETRLICLHIEEFKFGHTVFPVYRRPLVPLFNLMFPLLLLGLLNLAIFFQSPAKRGRKLVNLAAVLLGYLYLLPLLRSRIPPSSDLIISEIAVFLNACMTLFTLIHAVTNSYARNQHYVFVWRDEILFKIPLIFTFAVIGIIIAVSLVFAFIILPSFSKYG